MRVEISRITAESAMRGSMSKRMLRDSFSVRDWTRSLIDKELCVSDVFSRLRFTSCSAIRAVEAQSLLFRSFSEACRLNARAQRSSKVVKPLSMANARMSLWLGLALDSVGVR